MIIVGHRGAAALAPENTLRAIKKGIACADVVEVDVRLSRDNIPVVIHDEYLERTTNGHGRVRDNSIVELKQLYAGGSEKIPTLTEVFDVVKGERIIFIELKEQNGIEEICKVVQQTRYDNFVFVSFHVNALSLVTKTMPPVRKGLIYSKSLPNPIEITKSIGADFILPKSTRLTPQIIQTAHESGLFVVPWTYSTENEISGILTMDVDGFVSDNPCLARSILSLYN